MSLPYANRGAVQRLREACCAICTDNSKNTDFVYSVPEEELDELNIHVARHRPEELTKLAKTTKFSRKEIQLIYRGFKQVRNTLNSSEII
jgi:hypothetical protein